MPYAESKSKLGDRGSISGEKTFNTSSGTQNKSASPQTEWQGKTKGGTTDKESAE